MKRFIYILLGSGIIILLLIIKTSIFPEYGFNTYSSEVIELKTIVCGNCVETVKQALKQDNGIINANISLEAKTLSVKYDNTKTDIEKIKNLIVNSGYDANDKIADSTAYRNLSNCCQIWGNGNDYMKMRDKKVQGCKGGCCSN
ncbi:MAG TPA: heavy-metal-associated domain-containing protein [Ignavibacteria bacterium]|nr:heavy-metal-associated domain-containing protein [Ignavibacteria bacterium]